VVQVREQNRWERPRVDLYARVVGDLGYQDLWVVGGRQGGTATCRFDTRIDFWMARGGVIGAWRATGCRRVTGCDASDHHPVVLDLARVDGPGGGAGVVVEGLGKLGLRDPHGEV